MRGIHEWIANDNLESADAFLGKLAMDIEKIALTKNRGVPRDAIRLGLRAHIVGKYVIYFRTSENEVIIVRVLHSARDTKKLTFADEFD